MIKILIWHMVSEMVKKWGKVLFFMEMFLHTCTLHHLVKIKELKLMNFHTLACLNLSYGTTNKKQK